jgi:RNA polymerase sigma factor (sigma-70 family)
MERVLDRDEARALFARMAAGDARARDALVLHNMRLVVAIARQYARGMHDLGLEDLFQEGCIGLMRAIARFAPERGVRFSTYAFWWIHHAIQRAIEGQGALVRLPAGTARQLRAVVAAQNAAPGVKTGEIAARTGLTDARVVALGEVVATRVALDDLEAAALGARGAEGSPVEDEVEASMIGAEVRRALGEISPVSRRVLELRYGLAEDARGGMSLRAIAARLGLGPSEVWRLAQAGLADLRARLGGRP